MQYFYHDGLVVIGTWLITRSLLLSMATLKLCAIMLMHFGFGSNGDLVNHQVPFAFPHSYFIHKPLHHTVLTVDNVLTSLSWWGRDVISSIRVHQTRCAGSSPVVSTTVLDVSVRSIGNGQKNCNSCAWKEPREIGALSIFNTLDYCPFHSSSSHELGNKAQIIVDIWIIPT